MTLAAVRSHAVQNGAPPVGNFSLTRDPLNNSPQGTGVPAVGPHYYPTSPGDTGSYLTPPQLNPFEKYVVRPGVLGTAAVTQPVVSALGATGGPLGAGLDWLAPIAKMFATTPSPILSLLFGGGGGGKPTAPYDPTADINAILAAGGKGKGNAPAGTTGGLTPAQQAYATLAKNSNKIANTDFTPPYQQVTAQQVTPTILPNPFGKNGYQPPAQYEQGLSNDITSRLNNDYLGAFLPEAIKLVTQEYGPAVAAALFQGQQGANTIQGYNTGAAELLQGIAGKVGQTYDNSIGLQAKLDQGIRQSLAGQNPNNANLLPFGAPQAQANQINQQNNTSFNGAGAVLGGLGDLNASSLAAQKAAAVSAAMEMPGLNAFSGRQALAANEIGTQQALAKIQTQEGKDAITLAGKDQAANARTASTEAGLLKTQQSLDAKYLGDQIGIEKSNQSAINSAQKTNADNIQKANVTNASNQLSAIRVGNSIRNTELAQQRFNLSLTKAIYPTQSSAQQTATAKAAASWFGGGYQTIGRTDAKGNPVYTNVQSGSRATDRVYHQKTYADAVNGWAATHGGDIGQAQGYAAGFYNYGQGGRPLDPDMVAALQAAKLPPMFFEAPTTGGGSVPVLTNEQMAALNHAGYGLFVKTTMKQQPGPHGNPEQLSLEDAAKAGITVPPGKTAVTVWQIKPFGQG